jgi:hypothetical protein
MFLKLLRPQHRKYKIRDTTYGEDEPQDVVKAHIAITPARIQ